MTDTHLCPGPLRLLGRHPKDSANHPIDASLYLAQRLAVSTYVSLVRIREMGLTACGAMSLSLITWIKDLPLFDDQITASTFSDTTRNECVAPLVYTTLTGLL